MVVSKAKKYGKRLLGLLLALGMVTQVAATTVFAAQEDPAEESSASETQTQERFFPDYILEDYADVMYASGTIANNGCGIVCLASVATYMTGHQYYPDELARYFGGYIGTNLDRFTNAADQLGLYYYEVENYPMVLEALRSGKLVIQLMNSKSLFTTAQHFILIKGFNEDGLLEVYDPSQKNRDSWRLKDGFENGFTEEEICWGFDGAWVLDPKRMPEEPKIYEEPVRPYVEPRYTGIQLTQDEIDAIARLVWVESRGEKPEGQQAIAEVILNRYVSGRFGSDLVSLVYDEAQFVPRELLRAAKPSQTQYEAIDRALYGPYVLPIDVMFYGTVRTTDHVWGRIGGHIFCYPNDKADDLEAEEEIPETTEETPPEQTEEAVPEEETQPQTQTEQPEQTEPDLVPSEPQSQDGASPEK